MKNERLKMRGGRRMALERGRGLQTCDSAAGMASAELPMTTGL